MVTFIAGLVTFLVNLVTYWPIYSNHELICPVIIGERDIHILRQGTKHTTTRSCVGKQVNGICKKEHIAWHRSSHNNIIYGKPIRESSRAVYLHSIIKDEDADRGFRIQRAMYQSIYGELNKTGVGYLQHSLRIEFIPNLYMTQVPGEEIHNSLELMKQIAFNVGIIHFITKLCTAKTITHKTDTLCRHYWKPTLSVLPKQ